MKRVLKIFSSLLILMVMLLLMTQFAGAQSPLPYQPLVDGICSDYYRIDQEQGYILGITPGTPGSKLISTCAPSGLTVSHEVVVTGTTLTYASEGETPVSLTAVVSGDLNGDGTVTISDMLMVKSSILGAELSQLEIAAADLTSDSQVTITDFLKVKAYLLGLESLNPNAGTGNLLLMQPGTTMAWTVENAAGYQISDPELLTVDQEGNVTAAEWEGAAFIYALDQDGAIIARQLLTVLGEELTISLNTQSCKLVMGQTLTLTPVLNHPVNAAIRWETSDPTIVTVENGTLTAQQFGSATVTATLENGNQAQVSVTVAPPITELSIERNLHKIKPGNSKSLVLTVAPADSGEEIIWTSSDPSVASVEPDGTVTGINYGTVTITATGKYSGLTDSCTVKVCDVIQVAMTFDDGPSYQTEILLDFLKENEIHVTFFMVGNRINKHFKHIVVRSAAEGHEMGYHSYDHAEQTAVATQTIVSQFNYTDNLLYELTGQHFTVWRTPYGSYNQRVTGAVPLPHILWSLDTLDWSSLNADKVYKAIINGADDGDIILMHDLYASTVNGAIKAMKEMLAGDYEFLTVTELLSRNGKTPIDSKTYFSGR